MANILIVDDEETDRILERTIVENAGHAAFFANDGETALRVYEENDITVVITDLLMPNIDGLHLIQELRRRYSNALIIAVSGAADELDKAQEYGAIAALKKPVPYDKLLEAVQQALDNVGQHGDTWGDAR